MTKTAVVLLNLGGPLGEADIRPFLFNFFMDKNIIAAPLPLRWLIALYVSITRARGAAHEAYSRLGFISPLLANTRAQGAALEAALGPSCRVFTAMRYWHPFASETAREVAAWKPDEIVLLPLYPQYSTTTAKSAVENWMASSPPGVPVRTSCCWFLNEGFIAASAERIRAALDLAPPGTRLLFSAHGLPEKIIRAGDPYQWQCEQTAAAIAARLARPGLDWQICYQSRVGPLKWIGPSTDEALARAARDGVGVVIYPHAFVSEHVETLVEIEIEYRAKAASLPHFSRALTVGTHPLFIAGLADIVRKGSAPPPDCPCRSPRPSRPAR